MYLCKRLAGYHWSDIRWLIVFVEEVEEVEEVEVSLQTSAEMFAFLTVVSSRFTNFT